MRNPIAQSRATKLRKLPTDAERRLWYFLRRRFLSGCRFRRQVPIGPYIADFADLEHALIVELDGGQHAASRHDAARDRWFEARGFRVLRFWNNDVLQRTQAALEAIRESLEQRSRR